MNPQPLLCFWFPCLSERCQGSITLPIDAFEKLVPSQGESSSDDRAAILVCDSCRRAHIYSPLRTSRYHHPNLRRIECPRIAAIQLLAPLRCVGETHEFQAPLIAVWTARRSEQEKSEIVTRWKGDHLRCVAGHSIPFPTDYAGQIGDELTVG
jgi:hypothetical protein